MFKVLHKRKKKGFKIIVRLMYVFYTFYNSYYFLSYASLIFSLKILNVGI